MALASLRLAAFNNLRRWFISSSSVWEAARRSMPILSQRPSPVDRAGSPSEVASKKRSKYIRIQKKFGVFRLENALFSVPYPRKQKTLPLTGTIPRQSGAELRH
jgi:hypothetical protein